MASGSTVQRRLKAVAKKAGRRGGRPRGAAAKYFLTGLLHCGVCGGSMEVVSGTSGHGRQYHYRWSANHCKGNAICAQARSVPLAMFEDALIRGLATKLLRRN
jgi:hypothetical protein